MKRLTPIFLFLIFVFSFTPTSELKFVRAHEDRTVYVEVGERVFEWQEHDLVSEKKFNLSTTELLVRVYNMGFSPYECMEYVYPQLPAKVYEICKAVNREPINSEVRVETGEPIVTTERQGERVDTERLYLDLFYRLVSVDGDIHVSVRVVKLSPATTSMDNEKLTNQKSEFITYINGVNQEGRIHNIKEALSVFNGMKISPGEEISFNEIVGDTTEENGYALAKVILNGKYTEDYGGGVCQSATTLYNSALLAGLKILKVRPHSLKVGYVLGSFDAMVSNYSDLVIKNPYDYPVFIHTFATDTECCVKIFGGANEYEIVRRNERLEVDEEKFPDVSYKSEGYLDYFKNGELVKSEKIREDMYYKVKEEESEVTEKKLEREEGSSF